MNRTSENSEKRLIIAGFGGQGVLTAGKLLCSSCIAEGMNTTFLPSYGSEVRGGTANCHVVVSSSDIYGPAVQIADAMIILNEPSLLRFGKRISSRGLLLLNSSMVDADAHETTAEDVMQLEATRRAAELGSVIVANIIMLGALIAIKRICRMDTMETAIGEWLRAKGRPEKLQLNLDALHLGCELAGRAGGEESEH